MYSNFEDVNAVAMKALNKSIIHWEKVAVVPTFSPGEIGPENCALCNEFFRDDCRGCPVYIVTGKSSCRGTPHDDAVSKHSPDNQEKFGAAAREMLNALKDIRKEFIYISCRSPVFQHNREQAKNHVAAVYALTKSVEHWQELSLQATFDGEEIGVDKCTCCDFYYDDDCEECPIALRTGEKYCIDTPYKNAYESYHLFGYDSWKGENVSKFYLNASIMADFLKEVLENVKKEHEETYMPTNLRDIAIRRLRESIIHWSNMSREPEEGSKEELPNASQCACCQGYLGDGCEGCPIYIVTGKTRCAGTIYEKAQEAHMHKDLTAENKELWYVYARAMRDQLTSILVVYSAMEK